MLRIRLVTTFAVFIGFILCSGGLVWWGASSSQYLFERSQFTHRQLEEYLRLSRNAYRALSTLRENVAAVEPGGDERIILQIAETRASLERLRQLTEAEIRHVRDRVEKTEEATEREQLGGIEARVLKLAERIDVIGNARSDTDRRSSGALLRDAIGGEFFDAVDDAIAGEQREVRQADADVHDLTQRLFLIAGFLTLGGVMFAGPMAVLFVKWISAPIEKLLLGTQRIAAGNLAYRIELTGRDEFARLGKSFDVMAADLERHERALRDAQQTLEHEVAERTKDLATANDRLRDIDRNRRQFFAEVGHELRTPITIIRGEAEVSLRTAAQPAEYRTALSRIVTLCGQATGLVEDLLTVARSESGGLALGLTTIDLANLTRETCDSARSRVSQRGIMLVFKAEDTGIDCFVRGDRMRLRQVLLNLLDNALVYTDPPGSITVSVDASDNEAKITVSDSGVGIPEAELVRIFDRYYRSAEARKRSPDGSGLGLAVAKSLIEAHGGTITACGTAGGGTTMVLRLPRAHANGRGQQ